MRTVFRGSPFNYSYIQIFIYDKKVFASWMCLAKAFHRVKGDRRVIFWKLVFIIIYIIYNIYNNKISY